MAFLEVKGIRKSFGNTEVLKGIDRKIYVLTKCNTLVNRDLMEKRNSYLKKVKKE